MRIAVADSFVRRAVGLSFRRPPRSVEGLLIPRCRSVHTFGMRFALDLVWLDEAGAVIAIDEDVPPLRIRTRRDARAVLEVAAGEGRRVARLWGTDRPSGKILRVAEDRPNRWLEAFNPRVPLYRDAYNEYLVFIVSAIGAVAGTQVPLYLVMALTELWDWWLFTGACVVFELAVIFLVTRPQMKPQERAGWALLWGAVTAVMAVSFYYLVAEPTL